MLDGQYQRGTDSSLLPARLQIDRQGRVRCPEADIEDIAFADLAVSPRIGNSRRYVNFPDGGCFETDDNETVDRWVDQYRHAGRGALLVHRLEAKLRYVALAALVTVLFVYGFLTWGVPWLSERAAYALPPSVSGALGRGTLELLDRHLLEDTQLTPDRQRSLAAMFDSLHPTEDGFDLRLELRSSELIGANAFALPDGTVVITDDLVALADNEEQIAAVMLHEIAHVIGRHSLRGALQDAGLATLLLVVAGDVSSANSILVTLPSLLVRTSYSRRMETEADLYAARAMRSHRMDPAQLLAMLYKLEQAHTERRSEREREASWLDYLSSHPVGEERYAPLRELIER